MHGEQTICNLTEIFLQEISSQVVSCVRELQGKTYLLLMFSSSFKKLTVFSGMCHSYIRFKECSVQI